MYSLYSLRRDALCSHTAAHSSSSCAQGSTLALIQRLGFVPADPTAGGKGGAYLVAVDVAVKRAHRPAQAAAVRAPVLVSKREHLHTDERQKPQ